jgi:hypothetical protein
VLGQQTPEKWTNYPKFMFEHQAIPGRQWNPITSAPNYAAAYATTTANAKCESTPGLITSGIGNSWFRDI